MAIYNNVSFGIGRQFIEHPDYLLPKKVSQELYNFPVTKFTVYKALTGDKSDNIKGVEGFGPAKAIIKAIQAGSVSEDIYEMHGPEGYDQFKASLGLVNLDYKLNIDIKPLYSGVPIIGDEKILKKKYTDKVLLEVKRLKEEL